MADNPAHRAWPRYVDPRGAAYASIRASDADRERLIEVLKTGFAEGRLAQDEYNLRMERAWTARTYGELGALVSDLPAGVPQSAYGYPAYRLTKPNSMAVRSMIFGIAEFFTFGLTAVPAVILGHKALQQIRQTGEPGRGMAKAGLILGWTAIGIFMLLVALVVLGAVAVTSHSGHAINARPASNVGAWVMPYFQGPGTGG